MPPLDLSVVFELHLQGAEDLVDSFIFAADVDDVFEYEFFFLAGWSNVKSTGFEQHMFKNIVDFHFKTHVRRGKTASMSRKTVIMNDFVGSDDPIVE